MEKIKLIGPSKIPFTLNLEVRHEKLYYEGFYSDEEDYYVDLLSKYDNPIAFDAGANIGYFTCLFKSAGCSQIHSFEPVEEPYQLSREKLINILTQGIFLNKIGLYDKSMKFKKIYLSVQHNQGSSMSGDIIEKFKAIFIDAPAIKVPTITIDKYCKDNDINRIDLLKIDTEGTEYEIIKGAQGMIRKKAIENIIYESYIPEKIETLLAENGYEVKKVDHLYHPMFHATIK